MNIILRGDPKRTRSPIWIYYWLSHSYQHKIREQQDNVEKKAGTKNYLSRPNVQWLARQASQDESYELETSDSATYRHPTVKYYH